jgi:ubiquinone/menaquinone biosynthesis C-methylase UbiE|tara:strand:- start:1311 stop:1967 length:657 start_codon:yes stop_codon:yes gene_type:complete
MKTEKIEQFLKKVESEVYSEPDSPMHTQMIDMVVTDLVKNQLKDSDKQISILDIGCGQGYALIKFKEAGFENLQGITMSQEDVDKTIERGFKCENMDQSFMTFDDNSFDFMFSRHCLEHSPFPYLTLMEYLRVCKPLGRIYIEMPAPNNHRPLERIANHYSIMDTRMWGALMLRAGWQVLLANDFSIKLTDSNNPDKPFDEKNLIFVLQKPTNEQSTK